MTHSAKLVSLATLMLACAFLGACGGDAEAPPTPAASTPAPPPPAGPDTTAPTVTIATNVSAPTASGPVTFSFVFSEDVGVSFAATDIVVTGGTASGFTRLAGGTQAMVLVTPTANTGGTMTVSVAAGAFSDIAGNANTVAATASKPYITGQTITFTSPGNQTIGTAPPALVATSTSGLAVSIASTTASVCTVSGSTLTLVSAGSCSLTASQAGNSNFGAATSVTQTFTVTGGAIAPLTFSTGFAANNRTVEGGAYFSYSGSNQDGFNCTGGAAVCGSGNGGSGSTSFFFAYHQTPTPATALYNGISVQAPGVTAISATADTAGLQISGQTTVNFTFNNNPEWQSSGTNNFGVLLTLGKFYNVGTVAAPAPCNIKLLAVVTPLNNGAATAYAIALNSFAIIQACNSGISTVAAALASAPVSEVAFQAAGGTAALPTVGGKTTGANLSVVNAGVYPTTLALTGGVTFQP